MTDNEIIIPLNCLVMNESDCRHCKLKDKNDKCQKFLYSDVLGLIDENNRQKAEIERLEANLKEAFAEIEALKQINLHCKVESVKEFAERLKEYVESYDVTTGYKIIIVNAVEEETIDNLVKEMVGEG